MKKIRITRIALLVAILLAATLLLASCGGDSSDDGKITLEFYSGDKLAFSHQAEGEVGSDYTPAAHEAPFGYRFDGWYSADGVKYYDADGTKVPDLLIDRSMTLYAKTIPLTFNLVFSAGDYTYEGDTAEKTVAVAYDAALTEFPAPILPGHALRLDGYFTEDGVRYSNGTTPVAAVLNVSNFAGLTGETHLRAVYVPNKIKVTLDYNDGSLETVVLEHNYGDVLGSLDAYGKDTGTEGIIGWSTNPYTEVAPPETLTEDVRLYAVWAPYKTVSFVMPDGTEQAERIYKIGDLVTLPALTAPGYKLIGWHLTNALSGNKVTEVHYSTMQDTYYGDWAVTDYEITFAGRGVALDGMRYYYGDTVTLPELSMEGYTFYGWYIDDPDNCFTYLPADTWGDITLTAKLTPNNYALTLHPNGGTIITNFHMVEYGANYTIPVPSREGYIFLGWYDAARDGNRLTNQRGTGLSAWDIAAEDTHLYAYWDIISYNVVFNTNGGTSIAPIKVEHGGSLTLPTPPKKSGVLFLGWFNEDGSEEYRDGMVITGATILYAKWIESTPIFDAAGLLAIADNPSGNYHLMDNINMANAAWKMIPEFTGILDGQGYKIYNLLLTDTATQNYAMISFNKGTIRNLHLEEITYNYNITAYTYSGILTAQNYGTIENCSITKSNMLCKFAYQTKNSALCSFAGPIAGYNYGTVTGCYTDVRIEGYTTTLTDWVGKYGSDIWYYSFLGIGGLLGGNNATVSACLSDSDVYGYGITQIYGTWYIGMDTFGCASVSVGGLVGTMNEGRVELSAARGEALCMAAGLGCDANTFYPRIGGLVGAVAGGTVDRCYSAGAIQGYGYGATGYSGGFAGTVTGAEIVDCYTDTLVKVGSSGDYLGGFAAYVSGVITDCYANNAEGTVSTSFACSVDSTGTIRRCFSTVATTVFVGNSGIVDKCFVASDTPDGTSSMSPADLMSKAFLLDTLYWDEKIWSITEEGYPTLRGLTDGIAEEP